MNIHIDIDIIGTVSRASNAAPSEYGSIPSTLNAPLPPPIIASSPNASPNNSAGTNPIPFPSTTLLPPSPAPASNIVR